MSRPAAKLVVVPEHSVIRRDRRGRRIGHNWWREYITDLLFCAAATWERQCEAVALGYAVETAEYALLNPRPTLKAYLIEHRGMSQGQAA